MWIGLLNKASHRRRQLALLTLEKSPAWWLPSLWRTLEALPLMIFLLYAKLSAAARPEDWRGPYFAATLAALGVLALLLRRGVLLNRIYLALTLYFISGSAGLALHWAALNQLYGRLEATAMLVWVVAVGLASTRWSPAGFIAVRAAPAMVRRASLNLLLLSLLATLVSGFFLGNPLLSAYLPFIALFTAQGVLRARLLAR